MTRGQTESGYKPISDEMVGWLVGASGRQAEGGKTRPGNTRTIARTRVERHEREDLSEMGLEEQWMDSPDGTITVVAHPEERIEPGMAACRSSNRELLPNSIGTGRGVSTPAKQAHDCTTASPQW